MAFKEVNDWILELAFAKSSTGGAEDFVAFFVLVFKTKSP